MSEFLNEDGSRSREGTVRSTYRPAPGLAGPPSAGLSASRNLCRRSANPRGPTCPGPRPRGRRLVGSDLEELLERVELPGVESQVLLNQLAVAGTDRARRTGGGGSSEVRGLGCGYGRPVTDR